MSFTQNPQTQTQSTKRINLVGSEQLRGSDVTKDQRYVNMMPEIVENPDKSKRASLRTRPGLVPIYTLAAGTPRGIYYWSISGGHYISVISNTIYYDNVALSTIATSTGDVGFTEFLDDTGVRKLILVDGTNGYVFTAYNSVPVQITDADFPSPHIPNPIFLDGYLLLAKPNSQDVYNSNLNDPTLWTSGDFISAEMYPDVIVGLTINNNYLIAVGSDSMEYFYDAGNSPGTPLARQAPAVQQFGTPAPSTLIQTDKEVLLVGQTGAGGRTVWAIDGFKEHEISTPSIRYALDAEGTSIVNAHAYSIRAAAQKLYIIYLTSRVLVYSFDNNLWHEWSVSSTPWYSADSATGSPDVLVTYGGTNYIAKFDPTVFTDFGVANTATITTERVDFETSDRKRCDLFTVVCDAPNGASNTPLSLQWSDDDYQTLSTPTTIQLNPILSCVYRLGMFRRRSFLLTYTQPYSWRVDGLEISINKGLT